MTYGPIKTATKSLEALSAEHLETRALCASVTAKIALVELFSLISELAPDEQRELRLSMKAGLKKASGGRGEDARVENWAIQNPIESQMAMAWEATKWSAAHLKCEEPESRRKQLLQIAQTAHKVWKSHCSATDCVAELLSRRAAGTATLWSNLNT